jgi:hypothetical protein
MKPNRFPVPSQLADRYFELTPILQFVLWLALILSIKYDTLLAAPVWDTAMGVFPPAIFLYETNFDLLALVKLPGWWEGGPNIHTFSPWTWFIALVMNTSGSPTITFAIIHFVTFMINAFAISVFVRTLYRGEVSSHLALMSGLFLLLTPFVLVQIGYMYTESLVMSCSVLAWASWHNKCETGAVLFALIAIAIKLTGVVIAICLVPLLILRLIRKFSYKRLLQLISLPLALYILMSAKSWLGELPSTHQMTWGSQETIFNQLQWRMATTPDITNFIYLSALAAFCYVIYQWRLNPETNPVRLLGRLGTSNGSQFIALVYTPVFGIGIIVMSFSGILFLHRYAVPMIPFAIIQLVLLVKALKFQRELSFIFLIGCLVSIYNHGGVLYPATKAFSIVETSHAYKTYVLAQKKIIEEVGKLGNEIPIYVSREIDYMTSHPMIGYVTEVKPNIEGIYKQRYAGMSLEDFSDEYYVVLTNSGHGGKRIKKLIEQAYRAEGWRVDDIYRQNTGGYNMYIRRVFNATRAD